MAKITIKKPLNGSQPAVNNPGKKFLVKNQNLGEETEAGKRNTFLSGPPSSLPEFLVG